MRKHAYTRYVQDRLAGIRDDWIAVGRSTQPANRELAEHGVRLAYHAADLEPPETIVWRDSPRGGIGVAISLGPEIGHEMIPLFHDVHEYVTDAVTSKVHQTASRRLRDEIENQVRQPVFDAVWDNIGSHAFRELHRWASEIPDRIEASRTPKDYAIVGQHDADTMAFFDAYRDLVPEVKRMDGLMTVARNAGWWWAYRDVAILTERPTQLHLDERSRLHNPTGPALLYRDGFKVYAWHGVDVPRDIIESPETITAEQIDDEINNEVRRVMMERFGPQRYIQERGTLMVDRSDWGTLYERRIQGDEPLVMVKVANSTKEPDGTRKDYWLRVDPQIRPMFPDGEFGAPQLPTALNAIASTFGLTGLEYKKALTKQT